MSKWIMFHKFFSFTTKKLEWYRYYNVNVKQYLWKCGKFFLNGNIHINTENRGLNYMLRWTGDTSLLKLIIITTITVFLAIIIVFIEFQIDENGIYDISVYNMKM